jgi:1,4-dihydroxy-2-naphthoyl-CoA hydrolase
MRLKRGRVEREDGALRVPHDLDLRDLEADRSGSFLPGIRPGPNRPLGGMPDCRSVAATNPDITPELAARALAGSFPGDLGVELLEIDDGHVRGRLAADERHMHPGGYVHGGVWVAFADTVAAWGTVRHLPAGHDFTTVELKANVFTAARAGDTLDADGELLHAGRRTLVWEVRIRKGERLAANFVCTQMVLAPAA